MRKLLLLRGLPGSGKSHFISEHGLEPYTLSADSIRMLHASPQLQANGKSRIPNDFDKVVWSQLLYLLESRMSRGEFVIVDATHSHPRSFVNYEQLAKKHRYAVICVDFSTVPFETCLKRNESRPEYKVVPALEMQRMADNMQRSRPPKWISSIEPHQIDTVLNYPPVDVSQYTAIHHIGDIQGCFDPLKVFFDTHGINDDMLYVFVGDYLDRGTQNGKVMQWLLENYHRPNFIFIEGNHEAHLRKWQKSEPTRSKQFNQATAPELEAASISKKKVYGFLYKLREVFYYSFREKRVLVTHGGISTLPKSLAFINATQLVKGTGAYEESDIADASFAISTDSNTFQVHGHRNRQASPIQVNSSCFNLEGKVEFGGELRIITLDASGFVDNSVKSTIDASETVVEAAGNVQPFNGSVRELITELKDSNDIYEKPQTGTTISSFNFKRDVFFQKRWDTLNLHARGLFIDTENETIVARAYEKFFNIGERPETQPDMLVQTLHFPLTAWVKENGYLGLVGYDITKKELVFASKSSLSSEFAEWLKQQFDTLVPLGSDKRQKIEHYLSTPGKTLIFEVIEPSFDPHIITYSAQKLVLLDIVHNTPEFKAADGKERSKIAKMIGCESKKKARLIKDSTGFSSWLKTVQSYDYQYENEYIEGFVIEDVRGYMVKIKLPWYAFWRQMRTQLERQIAGKKTQLPTYDINNTLAVSFLEFLHQKSDESIKSSTIISLRDEFLHQNKS